MRLRRRKETEADAEATETAKSPPPNNNTVVQRAREPPPELTTNSPPPSLLLPSIFTLILILLSIVALSPHESLYKPYFQETLGKALIFLGWEQHSAVINEAYVAFLSWSTSYLFIRRLWNPETTNVTIEKYAADAVYGGFAASASVFWKHALKY